MTALIVLAAIVVGIWGLVAVLRMPLLPGSLVVILVSACFGYSFFFHVPIGASRWTVDRLMLPLLVAAFGVQRFVGRTEPKRPGPAEWLLIGLMAWLALSLLTHDLHLKFSTSSTPLWRFSTGYGVPALFYAIAWQSRATERSVRAVQAVLLGFGIYLATTGLLEITKQWALVFPSFIADPTVGIHFGRARGPMLSAVTFGLYLGVSFLTLWATRDRWRGAPRWTWLSLLTPLFGAGLAFTYTRSVWMGAGLGMVTVLALTTSGRARAVILAVLVGGATLLGITKLDSIVSMEREQSATETRGSAEARVSFAYISAKMWRDHPVFGVGFGQFPVAKLPYLNDRKVDLPLGELRMLVHHNTFLSLLVETGSVGLGLFLAMLAAWGRGAWRLCRSGAAPPWVRGQAVLLLGVLGLYACQLAFHELSYSTQDNCLIFFLAGMTAGLPYTVAGSSPGPADAPFGLDSE